MAGLGRCALAVGLVWHPTQGPAYAQQSEGGAIEAQAEGPHAKAEENQQDTVTLSVPLIYEREVYGDVVVQISPDGPVAIEVQGFQLQLAPLLNPAGIRQLADAVLGNPFVTPQRLEEVGFGVEFSLDRLELVVIDIDPQYRPQETIGFRRDQRERSSIQPTIEPASISAYLNIGTDLRYIQDLGIQSPDIILFGAGRYKDVVVEFDGGFSTAVEDGYGFYRRGVRAIYDEPESYRRWSAGDLRLQGSSLLSYPLIGGIAVEKTRRVFDPFSPVRTLGGREIRIDTPSTVEILVNGAPYQVLQLRPGTYSLEDLPVETGSNDIAIVVRDGAGREQVTKFGFFFEPIDLLPGEEEYMAALGVLSNTFLLGPEYSDEVVFVGNYRRGLSNTVAVGGGVQLTQAIQIISGEAQVIPQVVPGVFEVQGAVSNGDEFGLSVRAGYRLAIGSGVDARRIAGSINYQDSNFQTLEDLRLTRLGRFSANANYSQSLSLDTTLTTGASYFSRSNGSDRYNIYADVSHRIRDNIRASVGAEYGAGSNFERNFGIRASIGILLGGRNRADASYQSRRNTARASISRGVENHVGSLGYSVSAQRSPGSTSFDGVGSYVGNRFDARLAVGSRGASFGNIGERQSASLQLGTSIAFADGAFGIGRPITDSFLLVRPHQTLEKDGVIVGKSLSQGRYDAESGPMGAAVENRLESYSMQDVQYDLKSSRSGYNVGSGVERLNPPYRSGYNLIVGSARFVSAVGFLFSGGEPVSLVSGTITSETDAEFEPQPFFTNSVGRFGIIGLAPGQRYKIELYNQDEVFSIDVPADNEGLLRLGTVDLEAE